MAAASESIEASRAREQKALRQQAKYRSGFAEEAATTKVDKIRVTHMPGNRNEWIEFFEKYQQLSKEHSALQRRFVEKEEENAKLSAEENRLRRVCGILKNDREVLMKDITQLKDRRQKDEATIDELQRATRDLRRHIDEQNHRLESAVGTAKSARSAFYRELDREVTNHFGIPSSEVVIATFFCLHEGKYGHLYLTPKFLCYDYGSNRHATGIPVFAKRVDDIVRIEVSRKLYVCQVLSISFVDLQNRVFYFVDASSVAKNIVLQAQKNGKRLEIHQGTMWVSDGLQKEDTSSREPRRNSIDNSHLLAPATTFERQAAHVTLTATSPTRNSSRTSKIGMTFRPLRPRSLSTDGSRPDV